MADDPYTTLGPIPYELSVEEQRDAQLMLQQGMLNTKITLKTWAIVAAISIAAIAGIVLLHGYSTALFWIMLIGVAIFLAARIWGWPHFIRWQVEKEMAKHPMQAITGIKLGVQPQGLVMFQRMNNQEGRGVIGWKDFSEWRENDKYLYLTFSVKGQQGMQIIPKRMTAQRFPIDTVRKHLTETLGAAK